MSDRAWAKMPTSYGPHWFTNSLKDRDLAEFVGVSSVDDGHGIYFLRRGHYNREQAIRPDEGWWLPILDERRTAPTTGDTQCELSR